MIRALPKSDGIELSFVSVTENPHGPSATDEERSAAGATCDRILAAVDAGPGDENAKAVDSINGCIGIIGTAIAEGMISTALVTSSLADFLIRSAREGNDQALAMITIGGLMNALDELSSEERTAFGVVVAGLNRKHLLMLMAFARSVTPPPEPVAPPANAKEN